MSAHLELSANECQGTLIKALRARGLDWDCARDTALWCHQRLAAGDAVWRAPLTTDSEPRQPDDSRPGRVMVSAADWQRALDLAFETYVPESAASRLAGAGAGLTDND